ncbi:carbohydrate ABC transporter permease [Fictibacillus enclensis]|uniref:carbohydrate ABC transporter permease n=1 Tax=Fictibacillus enclensis TaxID=1017270 RepID=UPI0025A078EE|nr:carbohydrate ABC transporter permease [Fictibacillus enclensis]MDM5337285.1 carbohydrate ABC transporter permease [Fictibacillus enclensis]
MRRVNSMIFTIVIYIVAFLYFFPVLWIFITGFKTEAEAAVIPPSFIFEPIMKNFQTVWDQGVLHFLFNSAIVSSVSTLLSLLLGIPAAYALSMYKLKRENDILFWFISTRFLPIAGVIIPLFLVFRSINLLDTIWVLILVYAGMNTPLVIWMMRSFFKDIPYSLIEAAQVDGASGSKTFFSIVLPVVKTGLVSTLLLCMVFSWNEFFFALTLTYIDAQTMPVYMSAFMNQQGLFWAKMCASASFAILPVLILGWFSQKQLVRGLTMGAVKG